MAGTFDSKEKNNSAMHLDDDHLDVGVGAEAGSASSGARGTKASKGKSKASSGAASGRSGSRAKASVKAKAASSGSNADFDKEKADSECDNADAASDDEQAVSVDKEDASGESENNDIVQERNKYLRLAAEYDNFRKRSAKEREMSYTSARVDTIAKLLPVYDNLERALKMQCSDEAFYKGVKMTMTQLLEIFEDMDIKSIPAVGEPFDPNRHNAVMTIEHPELPSKFVAEEFQKGFILGDKVIRHSTVVVVE